MAAAEGEIFYNLNASSSPETALFGANFNNTILLSDEYSLAENDGIDLLLLSL